MSQVEEANEPGREGVWGRRRVSQAGSKSSGGGARARE